MKKLLLLSFLLLGCDNQGYKSDFDYKIEIMSKEIINPAVKIDGKDLQINSDLDTLVLSGKMKEFMDFKYDTDSLSTVNIYINLTNVYSRSDTLHEYKF